MKRPLTVVGLVAGGLLTAFVLSVPGLIAASRAPGVVIGCVYQTSPVTMTDGEVSQVQCADSSGHLSGGGGASGNKSNASSGVATSSDNVGSVSTVFGFNGTTWDQLQVDGSKFLKINCAAGCTSLTQPFQTIAGTASLASYSASAGQITLAATPTDVFRMPGSATKTIWVTRVAVSCTATAAETDTIFLYKRSTAGSGGTSANMTVIPHDSADAAGTAVPVSYTANPTVGTLIGALRTTSVFFPTAGAATTSSSGPIVWEFNTASRPVKGIKLNGTAENITIGFNGATLGAGAKCSADFEWNEQ